MKKILVLIITFHSFILTKLILFPYPELFVYSFLVKNGLLPYKQIFDQHFPGILMLPTNVYDFGLSSPESARLFLIGLTVASHILLFLVAKMVLKNEKRAVLANVIYLVLQPLFDGHILWIDSFLVPVLLASIYFFLRFLDKKTIFSLATSGFLMGTVIFLKQAYFPLFLFLGIPVYLVRKSIKDVVVFLGVGVIPLLLLLVWIYEEGIIKEFFYWTFIFNIQVYGPMARKLPTVKQLIRLAIFFLPAIYVFVARFKKDFKILILGIFLFVSALPAFSRFEFVHLQPSLPFMILFIVLFLRETKNRLILPVSLLILLTTVVWLPVYYKGHLGSFVYFFDKDTVASAKKAQALTKPKDSIFVFGTQPVIYPLANRLPSGGVFTISVPWNMKAAEDKILQGLNTNPPKVVVRDSSATIDRSKVVEFAPSIESYINKNYLMIDKIGANEILIPR